MDDDGDDDDDTDDTDAINFRAPCSDKRFWKPPFWKLGTITRCS